MVRRAAGRGTFRDVLAVVKQARRVREPASLHFGQRGSGHESIQSDNDGTEALPSYP